MSHISDWHVLNPADRTTYPQVSHPVQVRFAGGKMVEGGMEMFFPAIGLLVGSQITGWRYIRDKGVR